MTLSSLVWDWLVLTAEPMPSVTEQIYKSIDKGKISLLVLLDLSKAFDSVNHDLLLNKLV